MVKIVIDCLGPDLIVHICIYSYDWGSNPDRAGNFSLQHHVQTGSGAHPPFYPLGTRGSFPGVKQLGSEADHSPPSSAKVKECMELYLHFSNTFSWHGA
jgi:hypothetical protein